MRKERIILENLVKRGVFMQNITTDEMSSEEQKQFEEFKRLKFIEQTQAKISKIECDCLSPTIEKSALKQLCRDGDRLRMGGIVVLPAYVKACVGFLGNDPQCSLVAAISYPHGSDVTEVKAQAVKRAVRDGVDEVEVSVPYAVLKEGNMAYFKRECKKLAKAVRPMALRLLFDCSRLSEREILRACSCAAENGVNVIRLTECTPPFISAVKGAVKDKCLIKCDAHSESDAETAMTMGAALVSCKSATELCSAMLAEAQN